MLRRPGPEQTAIEMVTLDELAPPDQLLRKIDAVVDFSFIHDLTAPLYCADNGRPPLDPTLIFKALFAGYLFGVRSERQLVREIEVNVAYRWFLRLKLTQTAVDASTLSQNRRLRYQDKSVAQAIFDRIIQQAMALGLEHADFQRNRDSQISRIVIQDVCREKAAGRHDTTLFRGSA